MSKVGSWSTTAGNNNSTPPDGWPEGQAPSTVNDCAREMMAQIKTMVNTLEYIDLNNTPSFLTATTFSMATADVTNFVVGRRVKLFDANTMYGTIISVSATQVQVRLDYHTAQSALTAQLSSIAMSVVQPTNNSLPDNVWKRKNVIINGSMDIWQRSATFAPSVGGQTAIYTADRFQYAHSLGSAAVNISRLERSANASNVPSLAISGVFFNNSLVISVSAVEAAVGATEYALLETKIEGYDWRQIAHKPMNLSFWAKSRQSGTYCIAMQNSATSLSYVTTYTISAIETWTKFSMPIPEAPTTQTWDYSSGTGLRVRWTLLAGATLQGGAGNWTATSIIATAAQVNFLGSAGNTFAITGIQLEEGQFATPLEIQPYQQELSMCKRYYREFPEDKGAGDMHGYAFGTANCLFGMPLAPPMRASPTIASPILANVRILDAGGVANSVSSFTADNVGFDSIEFIANAVGTPMIAGQGTLIRFSAGGATSVPMDAEL